MNVWRVGSKFGDEIGPIDDVFRQYNIAFAGDTKPQEKIFREVEIADIIAITRGQEIIAVGRVREKKKLSEIETALFARFGDLNALVLEPLFWKNDNEKWLIYEGQGMQFNKAHDEYERGIISIYNERNRYYQRNKMNQEIATLLKAKKQVILTGAPGTGKTHLAKQIAAEMLGCQVKELPIERYGFVQFHPAYDYTDFVEGLKPVNGGSNTNNSIGFKLRDGIFMKFCKNAATLGEQPCVFVIDEINRADLSRVFGELFFALESGYRGEAVITQYAYLRETNEDRHFTVPKNVFIIGTMNDIDRSVESIDFALRRRFAWYEVKADKDRFDTVMNGIALEDALINEARKRYLSLNEAIGKAEDLGPAYQVGPAYFRELEQYVGATGIWEIFWKRHFEMLVREYVRGWPKSKKEEQIKKFEAAYNLLPETSTQT